MPRFVKKPVQIEAFQLPPDIYTEYTREPWWDAAMGLRPGGEFRPGDLGTVSWCGDHWTIHTLEGVHRADFGDYVIRGIKGELYPCKPDIFALTYDPV